MALVASICETFYAFALVFIVCELGQRVTNAYGIIENTIESFDWYLFPNELRHMLPFILSFAQQPITFKCFGRISCNRETFEKVFISLKKYTFNSYMYWKFDEIHSFLILFLFRWSTKDIHILRCSITLTNHANQASLCIRFLPTKKFFAIKSETAWRFLTKFFRMLLHQRISLMWQDTFGV